MKTFEDLIDVAIKAYKDRKIQRLIIEDKNYTDEMKVYICDVQYSFKYDAYIENHISFFKSLYKETFMIESQSDLSQTRLNDKKTKIVLANGELVTDEIWDYLKDISGEAQFLLLKGATVTQERVYEHL